MDKKQLQQMTEALEALGTQKDISKEDMKTYIEEVIAKVFAKDKDFVMPEVEEGEEIEITFGKVDVNFDINTGEIKIKRTWEVVEEVEELMSMVQISTSDERVEGLKAGEQYSIDIDLAEQPVSTIMQIKQLLIQRIREAEKEIIARKFQEHEGKIVVAKVTRAEEKYYILDYHDTSIFLPSSEVISGETFKVAQQVKVYIAQIDSVSSDAQVIGSRTNPKFVENVIAEEVEDVADGIVNIVGLSRIPGFKTKVAVESPSADVDPVGAIVGVKGNKIRDIMSILNGERVDVIKKTDDMEEFIASALTPAKVKGVALSKTVNEETGEDEYKAVAVVEEDQFLSALGKRGQNVKLAVRITRTNIDVKTVAEAKELGIEYKEIQNQYVSMKTENQKSVTFDDIEFSSIDDLSTSEIDIDMNNIEMEMYSDKEEEVSEDVNSNEGITLEEEQEIEIETKQEESFNFEEEEESIFDDKYDEYEE